MLEIWHIINGIDNLHYCDNNIKMIINSLKFNLCCFDFAQPNVFVHINMWWSGFNTSRLCLEISVVFHSFWIRDIVKRSRKKMKFFTFFLSICLVQVKFQSKYYTYSSKRTSIIWTFASFFVQVCPSFGHQNRSALEIPDINYYLTSVDGIKNVSQQMIEDVNFIHEKFPNNRFVTVSIKGLVSRAYFRENILNINPKYKLRK